MALTATAEEQAIIDGVYKQGGAKAPGLVPTPEEQSILDSIRPVQPKEVGGFIPAVKRGVGQYAEAIANTGALVGLGTKGLSEYGKELVAENPAATPATLQGLIDNPMTAIVERTGEQLANIGTSIAGAVAGTYLAGPAGTAVGLAPKTAVAIGAYLGGAAAVAPATIGEVGLRQEAEGVKDPLKQVAGGLVNAAIEQFGVQGAIRKVLSGAAEQTAAAVGKEVVAKYAADRAVAAAAGETVKNVAPTVMKTIAGYAKKAVSIAAAEALEEVPQNEVSRWAANQDILNKESLQEDIDNAASAFAGSLLFGAVAGGGRQSAENKAVNAELAKLKTSDEFKALPEGTQKTIEGTNPQQAQEYVRWASENAETVGDKRVARYGVTGAVQPTASFAEVNDAIKVLEDGAPVSALKVMPQIKAVDELIATVNTKMADTVQKEQAHVESQQGRVDVAMLRLAAAPTDPVVQARVKAETTKLAKAKQKLEVDTPAKFKLELDALAANKAKLSEALQPLSAKEQTSQTKALDVQRQKVLDKLHQVRGDMAYFQDLKYEKELESNPAARDTLTRDLFEAADAREAAASRGAEFEQATAQVARSKEAQLDLLQEGAPARTFTAPAPVTAEPTTALGQELQRVGLPTAPVTEPVVPPPVSPLDQAFSQIAAERVARAAPVTAAEVVAPVPVTPVVAPVEDNAAKMAKVYSEIGKTDKVAAALVRTMTKNIDVTDTQAVSDMLVAKAENPKTQTSFETLDKLHTAVTGVSLNDVVKGEQNVTPAASQAATETQAKTQKQEVAPTPQQVRKASRTVDLSGKFKLDSNTTRAEVEAYVAKAYARQTELEGKTVQQVARHIANTTPNAAYVAIAHRVEQRLNALEKQGMQFSFNIAVPGIPSPLVPGASGLSRFALTKTGSKTEIWVGGVGNAKSGLNDLVLLHELVHAATQTAIELGRRAPVTSKEYQSVQDLSDVFATVAKHINTRVNAAYANGDTSTLTRIEQSWARSENNAFHDLHELVAWTMTDRDMQALMDSVPYTSTQTLWNRFVASIRELLGLSATKDSALSEILRVTDELLRTDTEALDRVAQMHGLKLYQDSSLIEGFNAEGYITADTEIGQQLDNLARKNPTLATNIKAFLTGGVQGTTSSNLGKAQRLLEKNIQSPLHLASKSKGFSLTWDRVRQIPANAGYILNKAFAPLEQSWVKGMDVTSARVLQFATGIENTTFQDLRRAEAFLQEWNVSGLPRAEFLQHAGTIAKYGDMAASQSWFQRVDEARQAIDHVLEAQFMQNAEDMRSVILDDVEFNAWILEAKAVSDHRKDTGYTPIRRYGDYSVAMYDTAQRTTSGFPTGDLGLMGKWYFQSEAEARDFIRDVKEQYRDTPTVKLDSDFTNDRPQYIPKAKSSQYSYSTVSFRQFLEIAKRANVPVSATEQQRLAKLMINADSMYQNRIQRRKNIPGGTKDIVRSMSEFITHISNKVASDRMAPRISQAMNITRPLSPEEVSTLALLQGEFQWVEGKSEQQVRDAIHDQVSEVGGSLADEVGMLSRFNTMRELESNGFLAWRTSVDINSPQEVAEYYDLLARNSTLVGAEIARFDQLSTPDPQAGFYHDKIAQHVEFLNNPKSEAFANLRRFAAINFLGGSLSAMVVNMSSLPLNFMPYMHQYGGMSAYTKTMHWFGYSLSNPLLRNTIFKNNTAELEQALTPEGKLPDGLSRDQATALLRAFREEVVSDTQVFEYFAAAKHGVQIGTVLGQRAQAAWMAPFRVSEMTNRVTSFLTAYDIAQTNKMDGKILGAEEAYQFARRAVDQTQFIYGPINRMGIAQNPVGFALMTFRAFPIMTIELLSRLPAKQRTIMLGTMLLMSGVNGIPFKEDLVDILDTIGQKLFGVPLNTNRVLHNYFKTASEAIIGTDLSRLAMTGPLDVLTGASIGSRVSLSNIIPASRLGVAGYSLADGMLDLSGVIGAELKGLTVGAGQLVQGNTKEALAAAAPTAVRGIVRFTDGVTDNRLVDKNGNILADDLTMSELGLLGAGFTLSRSNWQSGKNYTVNQELAYVRETTATMFDHVADAIQKGDYDEVRNSFETVRQWNEENPSYPYKINPASLRRELMTRNMPAGQREFMKIKKAWRGEAVEDLLNE